MTKIISFEGLDKSGKHSALNVIKSYLINKGYSVEELSFPNYKTEVGKLIRKYLIGELKLDKVAFETLQATDKLDGQRHIKELIGKVDYILIDRYIHSQFAYGMNNVHLSYLEKLLEPIISPDIVLYLDVSVENSMNRKGEHGDNDIYESNKRLLSDVKSNYEFVFNDKFMMFETELHIFDANKSLDEVTSDLLLNIDTIIR